MGKSWKTFDIIVSTKSISFFKFRSGGGAENLPPTALGAPVLLTHSPCRRRYVVLTLGRSLIKTLKT